MISCIGDARLRGGDASAGIEHAALGADDAARLAHAVRESDLEFQRGVAGTRGQRALHGEPHRGIQEDRGIAAVHRADRIIVAQSRHAVDHDEPGSAVQSNGSTVCIIGGSGNRLAKIARKKSSPDIDAITSTGVTPYLIVCSPDLSMIGRPFCLEKTTVSAGRSRSCRC
jgi:hypothetical protein